MRAVLAKRNGQISRENATMKKWRFAGIGFDHMHMGDLLQYVHDHPNAEIVGVYDADAKNTEDAARAFEIPDESRFTDIDTCIRESKPDIAILCPATAKHAEYVEKMAKHGVHMLVEKPFAMSAAEVDRMIRAAEQAGKTLVVNWPSAWSPSYVTMRRLITEGLVGDVVELHHYGGNRGPLYHLAGKVEVSEEVVQQIKGDSWWYNSAAGGGSLRDYMGYGATLGTWFMNGEAPIEVTCISEKPEGSDVDEHSIAIVRYARGLSKFETRWGTFTDPWTHQPQPKCGFVVVGTKGTISAFDYDAFLRVQTSEHPEGFEVPLDTISAPRRNPIEYLIHCLETGEPISGPLSLEVGRTAQRIVDTAILSAAEKRTISLVA